MLLLLLNHTTGASKRNTRVGNKRRYHPQILGCPHSIVTELSTCQRSEIPNLRSAIRHIREKKHDVFTWAGISAGHSLGRFCRASTNSRPSESDLSGGNSSNNKDHQRHNMS